MNQSHRAGLLALLVAEAERDLFEERAGILELEAGFMEADGRRDWQKVLQGVLESRPVEELIEHYGDRIRREVCRRMGTREEGETVRDDKEGAEPALHRRHAGPEAGCAGRAEEGRGHRHSGREEPAKVVEAGQG